MTGLLEPGLNVGEAGWPHRLEVSVQGRGQHPAKWTAQARHQCGQETEAPLQGGGTETRLQERGGSGGGGERELEGFQRCCRAWGLFIGPTGSHPW